MIHIQPFQLSVVIAKSRPLFDRESLQMKLEALNVGPKYGRLPALSMGGSPCEPVAKPAIDGRFNVGGQAKS